MGLHSISETMFNHRGVFENGFPFIDIEVIGNGEARKVRAIIDTGFNDYLTLPYEVAFPLGLTLLGVESAKQADGTSSSYLSCVGTVVLGEKRIKVAIDVQQNGRILLGTKLLQDLNVKLEFDPKNRTVQLVEN